MSHDHDHHGCNDPHCTGGVVDEIRARFGAVPYWSLDEQDSQGQTIEEQWETILSANNEHDIRAVLEGREPIGEEPIFISVPVGDGDYYRIHLFSEKPEFTEWRRAKGIGRIGS